MLHLKYSFTVDFDGKGRKLNYAWVKRIVKSVYRGNLGDIMVIQGNSSSVMIRTAKELSLNEQHEVAAGLHGILRVATPKASPAVRRIRSI